MHIVDGALSTPVLAAGAAAAVAGVALGLKKMEMEHIPQAGVMSAVFFVASLVHVPIGLSSVHLILNGLMGLALGWVAFPAILIALLLQAVFFGFGGITVLGVNTVNIALPAVAVYHLFGPAIRSAAPGASLILGSLAGAGAIALTTLLVALSLALSGEEFLAAAQLTFFAHIPVMFVEGLLTGAAAVLINRVKPALFEKTAANVY
jgi:cobalt/nickel transport system permease protein